MMSVRRAALPVMAAAAVLAAALSALPAAYAGSEISLSKGATVYVPIYSNVYTGSRQLPFQLAATLVIRNTDTEHPLTIERVDYYDTAGKLVRGYIDKPRQLGPLASTNYYIQESDKTGGSGANFIVRWKAGAEINRPIIEGVMVGSQTGRGISYLSPGQEIDLHGK
jgi:hypothetical protein